MRGSRIYDYVYHLSSINKLMQMCCYVTIISSEIEQYVPGLWNWQIRRSGLVLRIRLSRGSCIRIITDKQTILAVNENEGRRPRQLQTLRQRRKERKKQGNYEMLFIYKKASGFKCSGDWFDLEWNFCGNSINDSHLWEMIYVAGIFIIGHGANFALHSQKTLKRQRNAFTFVTFYN